jgi:predicted Zn-dependent protease
MRHTLLQISRIPLLLTVVAAGLTSGCAINPVSGTPDVVFMSEVSEINIGNDYDAKIREKYGVYDNPELQAYINRIGQQLAAHSHRPGLTYHFTVLNSPEVNAFALPGGYIYITRGILAYLNSEAELAAVLGHEIGHVTARHAVRQHTASTATGFVGAVIGIATGIGATQDLFNNVLGNAILSGYGRDHELESDRLGAEYLARAGYDPQAVIKVLGVLKNQEEYEKKRAAAENRPPHIYHGVYASHPSADQRLQEVVGQADKFKSLAAPQLASEAYLKQIENLLYGDITRSNSVRRGNSYYHKAINVALSLPQDWQLSTSDWLITATSPDSKSTLRVDIEDLVKDMQPDVFLKTRMGVTNIERGGALVGTKLQSYSGIVPSSPAFVDRKTRVTVVDYNNKRFLFSGAANMPENFTASDAAFISSALSLRPLNAQEKVYVEKATNGLRVHVIKARPGDNFISLAKMSPIKNDSESILRLINNRFPAGEPAAGELIKIIE